MTFPKTVVVLFVVGVLLFSCVRITNSTPKAPLVKTETTTLFDGQVMLCYSENLAPLIQQGKTGFIEIDEIEKPSLAAMNHLLEPYGRGVFLDSEGDSWWVPSGSAKYHRLCDIEISETAKRYRFGGRSGLDASYDYNKAIPKPTKYPDYPIEGFLTYRMFWFEGDKLIYIEMGGGPKVKQN